MKGNKKTSLIIMILLLVVGVTTGYVASTYAKYTSNLPGKSGTATVAKWGYTVSATAQELFGQHYGAKNNSTSLSSKSDSGVNVSGKSGTVIAPGTTGHLVMSVSGDAEVLSQIITDIKITDIVLNTKIADTQQDAYYPLNWELTTNQTIADFDGKYHGATLANELEADLVRINKHFEKVALGTTVDYSITLSWTWAFSTSAENDVKDTVFGGLSNATGNTSFTDPNTNIVYTNNNSVFEVEVSGNVLVQQIQL